MLQRVVPLGRLAVLERAAVPVVRLLAGHAPLLAPTGGAADAYTIILPGGRIVGAALGIVSGEQPVEVLGVGEVLVYDRRRVAVVDNVLLKVPLVFQDVVDDAAQE